MHSERMSKLEMRIGGAAGKVIAECPAVDIDKMVSLVEEFREIRAEDMMWKMDNLFFFILKHSCNKTGA